MLDLRNGATDAVRSMFTSGRLAGVVRLTSFKGSPLFGVADRCDSALKTEALWSMFGFAAGVVLLGSDVVAFDMPLFVPGEAVGLLGSTVFGMPIFWKESINAAAGGDDVRRN